MIKVLLTVAMDYSLILDRAVLAAIPEGTTVVLGRKMAGALTRPLRGKKCLILDDRGLRGWGRVDFIPEGVVVIGGFSTAEVALGIADEVTLVVRPFASGMGGVVELLDFTEDTRVPFEGGFVVKYKRLQC